MNKIEKLIAELCPQGVEWKALGEIVEIHRGRRLVRTQLEENGKYAVYQNSMTPLGYYHENNVKADTTFVICAGAAGEIGYSKDDFWAADDVYYVEVPISIISKFVFYFLLSQQPQIKGQVRRASIPRLAKSTIERLNFPIPPLPIQQEIVTILDKFTSLEAELEARTRQYEFYRNQLLSFDEDEVGWKTLGEVCQKTENVKWKDSIGVEYEYIDLSSVDRETYTILETQTISADNAPSRAQQIVQNEDVIFGTTRPTLRRYCFIKSEYDGQICSTGFCVLRANKNINDYLILYLN